MSAIAIFRGLARNNAWANLRLLSACETLSQADVEARRAGFFPSLTLTLNHILTVDWFYVNALEGGDLGQAAYDDETPCRTLVDLRHEQAAVDRRLIALCDGLTAEGLGAPVRLLRAAGARVERVDRLLLHLFQHQMHHRGQAHAMLAETSAAPPQLDEFFLAEDASRRADDLAALGWSEEDHWGGSPP